MALCGGVSDEVQTQATPELLAALEANHAKIVGDAGVNASKLNLVHYKTQVVSGTNYFVKCQLDDGEDHVHVRMFQDLPHRGGNFEVHGVQAGHKVDSELAYF